jgi:hypothetical protein
LLVFLILFPPADGGCGGCGGGGGGWVDCVDELNGHHNEEPVEAGAAGVAF